jgi:hypothetical protein
MLKYMLQFNLFNVSLPFLQMVFTVENKAKVCRLDSGTGCTRTFECVSADGSWRVVGCCGGSVICT